MLCERCGQELAQRRAPQELARRPVPPGQAPPHYNVPTHDVRERSYPSHMPREDDRHNPEQMHYPEDPRQYEEDYEPRHYYGSQYRQPPRQYVSRRFIPNEPGRQYVSRRFIPNEPVSLKLTKPTY